MKTIGEEMAENAIISMNRKIPQAELRDLFAMNALNGMLASDYSIDGIAERSYMIADAMLEARRTKRDGRKE